MNPMHIFIEKSAKNFGVDFPMVSTGISDEIPIQKSSVWPLHDRMLRMLDVVPLEGDFKAFAQVYAVQVWAYVASWIISSSIGSLPFQLCTGKRDNPEIIDEGDAYKLLEYPNEWESGSELREDLTLFLELTGNGYWEKWGSVGGLPVKLFNLEPYFVRIKEHPTLKIDYYQYDTGQPDGIKKFNTKLITQFKYANPNNIFYGQGSIAPLQSTLITELYREAYNKSFFENEARPDVILKHNPDITKGILPLQPEARRKVAQSWYNTFGGPRKSRLPVLLESGMDLEVLSEARRDMDFREMERSLRERIFGCFGVPPALANIYETANYATVKEQVRIFWRVTLPPKCQRIANTITRSILKPYDDKLWCRFDLSDISALEETVKEREERLSRMLERGGLSLGQYRQLMGLRVEPDDPFKDKRVISANLIPLDDFFAGGGTEIEPKEPGAGGPPQTAGPGFPGEEVKGPERGTHKFDLGIDKMVEDDKIKTFIAEKIGEVIDYVNHVKPEINISVPAPNINVTTPDVKVTTPASVVTVNPPDINVSSPTVNVTTPDIHVGSPIINVETPVVKKIKRIPVRDKETGLIIEVKEIEDD